MKARLANLWESLRTSYWFLPLMMSLGAILLSLFAIQLDTRLKDEWTLRWMWRGSPEGARQVLSTIAGSMITVAGVTFSITIVALAMTSAQYGPRLLRKFMRDTGNQVVLGTFVATYLYCLLVLRAVRGTDDAEFIPDIAVTVGLALAICSIGVLIYFIHHISDSIQAENLAKTVSEELKYRIRRLFPEQLDAHPQHEDPPKSPDDFDTNSTQITARTSGYISSIDNSTLMQTSAQKDLVVKLLFQPGNFVVEKSIVAQVWPRTRCDEEAEREISGCFLIGRRRTPTQDVEYGIHELVDIALRALSPSINDTFTAVTCVDWLSDGLALLAQRKIPPPFRCDDDGNLRVIGDTAGFKSMADAAFHKIRREAADNVAVTIRLLEAISTVAEHIRRDGDRSVLAEHARLIARNCEKRGSADANDLRDVREAYEAAMQRLNAPTSKS